MGGVICISEVIDISPGNTATPVCLHIISGYFFNKTEELSRPQSENTSYLTFHKKKFGNSEWDDSYSSFKSDMCSVHSRKEV